MVAAPPSRLGSRLLRRSERRNSCLHLPPPGDERVSGLCGLVHLTIRGHRATRREGLAERAAMGRAKENMSKTRIALIRGPGKAFSGKMSGGIVKMHG